METLPSLVSKQVHPWLRGGRLVFKDLELPTLFNLQEESFSYLPWIRFQSPLLLKVHAALGLSIHPLRDSGPSPLLVIVHTAAVNSGAQDPAFNGNFGMPRSGISGSHGDSSFNLWTMYGRPREDSTEPPHSFLQQLHQFPSSPAGPNF